tara:strand:+ start:587 stop:1441 length:855 start_codon:yes stop_codon:yes gene_type:complete
MLKVYKKKKEKYLFSIICATINNLTQIKKLCNSLQKQNYKKFELIICDQNKHNDNKIIKNIYKNLKIQFIKSSVGLSRARNKGISLSKGNFLIFLDDDVTFKKNYLKKVNNLLNKKDHQIIAYRVVDKLNRPLLNYPTKNCYLENLNQIFNSISSVSFVIKNEKRIFFDNKIGLGSKDIYQSGEETDFIIRAKKKFKYKIFFDRSIKIIHERKKITFKNYIKKSFLYGCGWSYVVKKNNLSFNFIKNSIFKICLNFGYHILSLNFKKTLQSLFTILGRIYGLIK